MAVLATGLAVFVWWEDPADCVGAPPVALDIAACTRQIESGLLSPNDLAITYYARARAYEIKKQSDHAIADYRAAHRLMPGEPAFAKALKRLGAAP